MLSISCKKMESCILFGLLLLMVHMYWIAHDKCAKANTCLKASQLEFIDVGFFKLNNNQPINLSLSQIMQCIIAKMKLWVLNVVEALSPTIKSYVLN